MRTFICYYNILWVFFANNAYLHSLKNTSIAEDARRNYDTDFNQFMGDMFSMHPYTPVEEEKSPNKPNLAYEPYWTNVSEVSWDLRCKQCAEAFKRFNTVCAVDGTGTLHVNVSMCGMMRQNCENSAARGRSSGRINDFSDKFVVEDGWARFSIRQKANAIIILASSEDMMNSPPYYRVVLDGWEGKRSKLQRDDTEVETYENKPGKDKALGQNDSFIEFVARWDSSGWILITKSSYENWTTGFHFNYTDPNPFKIKFIAISGYNKTLAGDWILNDLPTGFIMRSMGACSSKIDDKRPTLQTNPTSVKPIIDRYSVINKDYFDRLKVPGIDPHNDPPLTAEDY